ncbi:Uncharacterised protein [Mycobacteroides abscessus subsp. abscessus]|nr:Uncharacterised protein [Mycobacteroides abscessus subsp. abscessus]
MMWSCLSDTRYTPLSVSVPGLPIDVGMLRMSLPSRLKTTCLVRSSAVTTIERPTVKFDLRFS